MSCLSGRAAPQRTPRGDPRRFPLLSNFRNCSHDVYDFRARDGVDPSLNARSLITRTKLIESRGNAIRLDSPHSNCRAPSLWECFADRFSLPCVFRAPILSYYDATQTEWQTEFSATALRDWGPSKQLRNDALVEPAIVLRVVSHVQQLLRSSHSEKKRTRRGGTGSPSVSRNPTEALNHDFFPSERNSDSIMSCR